MNFAYSISIGCFKNIAWNVILKCTTLPIDWDLDMLL